MATLMDISSAAEVVKTWPPENLTYSKGDIVYLKGKEFKCVTDTGDCNSTQPSRSATDIWKPKPKSRPAKRATDEVKAKSTNDTFAECIEFAFQYEWLLNELACGDDGN